MNYICNVNIRMHGFCKCCYRFCDWEIKKRDFNMEIRRFPFSYDEGLSLRRTPWDSANYGEQGTNQTGIPIWNFPVCDTTNILLIL